MSRTITPRSTFVSKFLFPPLWLGFIGAMLIMSLIKPTKDNPGMAIMFPVVATFILIGGFYYIVLYHLPLKRVSVANGGLMASNYRTEIYIPFQAVESIIQLYHNNHRYIVVRLNTGTVFGRRFTMLPMHPRKPWSFPWGEDVEVAELRKFIKPGHDDDLGDF